MASHTGMKDSRSTSTPTPRPSWHTHSPEQVCQQLDTSPQGLDSTQADARLQLHGPNRLTPPKRRSALQRFAGPQLHLLAGADALVPAEVAGELLALQPDIEVGLIEEVSHAFPLERPHEVAAAIHAFITEAGDV